MKEGDSISLRDERGGTSVIAIADVCQSNGVIHVVTSVMRVAVDIVNLFDTESSDIDCFYVSRLPGEPAGGIAGFHLHPTLPRTTRLNLILRF